LVAWDDPDYPGSLLEIGDPPPVFYCLGRRELLAGSGFAIVGSRNATAQGRADAQAFAAALSATGFTIVSGLAIGIDAAAHRGGLAHAGSSIAVVGTGLDRVYPAANRELARELAVRGLVVSEFAPGTPPLKQNFPRRNRLVSGLSRGVLVVEATLSSGSLITARFAGEQGREVFALPGSIHSPFSKGGHKLIREGAKLVETAQDILDELGHPARAPAPRALPRGGAARDATADAIVEALGYDPADVDTLAARTGLPAAAVAAGLTALELDGRVAALAGGLWQRTTG
jgi:DNA processing protein